MRIGLSTLAGLTLAMLAGQAQAQSSDDGSVPVSGTVSELCILGAPSPSAIDLGQMIQTAGLQAGRLATIPSQNIQLPASFCNYAGTQMQVSASALLAADTSAVQAGFTRAVNYTAAVADWAATPATATTAATASGLTPTAVGSGGVLAAPKQANVTVTLSTFTAPANALLVAGAYSGSVTITVGPDLSIP